MDKFVYYYDWQVDIWPRVPRMQQSEQGFTSAYTGLVTLADGSLVFVKCAMDENSAHWARKELKAYKELQAAGYDYIPRLLAANAEGTAFATQALIGYDFSPQWNNDKLHAVVRARKDLKAARYLFEADQDFSMRKVVGVQDRWPMLLDSNVLGRANQILRQSQGVSVSGVMVERCVAVMQNWHVRQDTLVHDDLRADNFAYDPQTKTGKLIDWSWLCVGDDALDVASLCVGIENSGFDVYGMYPDLFDEQAIISTLGYWLEVLGTSDGQLTEVRVSQAATIKVCYDLLAARTQLTA